MSIPQCFLSFPELMPLSPMRNRAVDAGSGAQAFCRPMHCLTCHAAAAAYPGWRASQGIYGPRPLAPSPNASCAVHKFLSQGKGGIKTSASATASHRPPERGAWDLGLEDRKPQPGGTPRNLHGSIGLLGKQEWCAGTSFHLRPVAEAMAAKGSVNYKVAVFSSSEWVTDTFTEPLEVFEQVEYIPVSM